MTFFQGDASVNDEFHCMWNNILSNKIGVPINWNLSLHINRSRGTCTNLFMFKMEERTNYLQLYSAVHLNHIWELNCTYKLFVFSSQGHWKIQAERLRLNLCIQHFIFSQTQVCFLTTSQTEFLWRLVIINCRHNLTAMWFVSISKWSCTGRPDAFFLTGKNTPLELA